MRRAEAICDVSGCRDRAVFATSTEEATVVLCRRHLERWRAEHPEDERTGGERPHGDVAEAAA